MDSPVAGLRPLRAARSDRLKLPKPGTLAVSPDVNAAVNARTTTADAAAAPPSPQGYSRNQPSQLSLSSFKGRIFRTGVTAGKDTARPRGCQWQAPGKGLTTGLCVHVDAGARLRGRTSMREHVDAEAV